MNAYFSNSARTHAEELLPVVIEKPSHYTMSTNDSDDTDRLEQYIRDEKGHLDSCESMVELANWLYANEYFETNDREIPTSDLKEILGDRLEYGVNTLLDHLEGINVVDEVSQGGGRFILHERTGRAFFDPNNREMLPLLEEEISRFLEDLHEQESQAPESEDAGDDKTQSIADGGEIEDADSDETDETDAGGEKEPDDVPTTLREVAAAALDVEVPLEDALTNPTDHIERIIRFDDVVTAVIESDEVGRGRAYEPMGWRNAANKWVLTMTAKARKENESLS
ncbi:hypothetical protein SAMN05444422_1144 [Halobiforma haloterrestris]|uniref:Uncharacterized protein n=1 Tax=Natronobacterium haloterrestre TaxID=148448 RepID=A0A1I1LC32_NATHA|nr:hypothetical protein [Halobiforma haloterrestris]SFC67080.1 hypothetical protein SAMN05444422_1144 [Halobiforma haloterrestris]